jgi:uncharacterized protein YfaQ (DUF2300 family)
MTESILHRVTARVVPFPGTAFQSAEGEMAYPTELEHAVQQMREAIDAIGRAIAHAPNTDEAFRVFHEVMEIEKDTAKLYVLASAKLDARMKEEGR